MDDPDSYPVLIHCNAGLNRTGVMVAVYRMEYQGWDVPPSQGNFVWVQQWGDKDHDQGRGVAIDDKGAALVTGFFRFTLDLVTPPVENARAEDDPIPKSDVFVVKLDR